MSCCTEAVVMCGEVAVSLLTKMMVNVVRDNENRLEEDR